MFRGLSLIDEAHRIHSINSAPATLVYVEDARTRKCPPELSAPPPRPLRAHLYWRWIVCTPSHTRRMVCLTDEERVAEHSIVG